MMDARAINTWFSVFDWSPTDPQWEQRRKATWAWRKFKKARRWARILKFAPFVRMIAIGNSLGYGNCSPESDIDLVIITAPRHIWTVRLIVVALLRLFRQRPGERTRLNFSAKNFGGHTRDSICPSFFLTTEALNFEPLQLPPLGARGGEGELASDRNPSQPSTRTSSVLGRPPLTQRGGMPERSSPDDPYLLFWLIQLTVLYDVGGTYEQFWRANEAWVRRWLPDARARAVHPRLRVGAPPPLPPLPEGSGENKYVSPPLSEGEREGVRELKRGGSDLSREAQGAKWERGCTANFGDLIERWSRRFQERRFSPEIRALANRDSRVIVNDRMLKFHANDRRAHYREQWLHALSSSAAAQQR